MTEKITIEKQCYRVFEFLSGDQDPVFDYRQARSGRIYNNNDNNNERGDSDQV
jgi:hypothetical protein